MKPLILLSSDYVRTEKREIHSCDSRYVTAVSEAGAVPVICPALNDVSNIDDILGTVHGIVFIGGADYPPELYDEEPHPFTLLLHPVRSESDILLCRAALKLDLPILGICGGCQLINIVCGGKLIQHIVDVHHTHESGEHTVFLSESGILHDIYGDTSEISVKSFHHQAVDPAFVGNGLRVAAKSLDGIVEAVEADAPGKFILGVQWHPERYDAQADRLRIFSAFVRAASARMKQ